MGYSQEVIAFVEDAYERKRANNERLRAKRLAEAYSACPQIEAIDKELSGLSLEVMGAISLGKGKCSEQIAIIKEKNLALQAKRASLLEENGFDKGFTDLKYECDACRDTGYVNGFLCSCYRNALRLKSYESSGLSRLLDKQSFETFSLDYYAGADKDIMKENFDDLYSFASNFKADKRSFLLCGATGLGKTHLSTAVAKRLIDDGYYVIYETAQNVFHDFEVDRVNLSRSRFDYNAPLSEPVADKYLECDLLIIDDLGTEMISAFSTACLYNIINTRLNKGLPIIASTNLKGDEVQRIYDNRITSRLFGEFSVMRFSGIDVRRQKLKK